MVKHMPGLEPIWRKLWSILEPIGYPIENLYADEVLHCAIGSGFLKTVFPRFEIAIQTESQ